MPKLHLITYGCQMNEYDSERVAGLLRAQQYELCDRAEDADLILLNTCSIREKAEDKVFSQLGALKRLKTDAELAEIPIIMLTARSQDEDVFEGYGTGAQWYLTKPFEPQELRTVVRHLLARGAAEEAEPNAS